MASLGIIQRRWIALVALTFALLPNCNCGTSKTGGSDAGPDAGSEDALPIPADCSIPKPGCPCSKSAIGTSVACYEGPLKTVNVGTCRPGTTTCESSGYYGACAGEVVPAAEICDHMDHNCNGVADDGVLSSCGNCDQTCMSTGTGTGSPTRFTPNVNNSDGVSVDPNGNLVLNASQSRSYYAWIANSGEGTVSKLDSRTGREVARYATIRPQDPRLTGVTLPPWNEACQYPNGMGFQAKAAPPRSRTSRPVASTTTATERSTRRATSTATA
jgi:hypothetical protein